jgi:hypothetical protein
MPALLPQVVTEPPVAVREGGIEFHIDVLYDIFYFLTKYVKTAAVVRITDIPGCFQTSITVPDNSVRLTLKTLLKVLSDLLSYKC